MIGILLAAGKGTRMKNTRSKLLFDINGHALAYPPFKVLLELCREVVVVVGYQGPDIKKALLEDASRDFSAADLESKSTFITQNPPKGTGDALKTALKGYGKSFQENDQIIVLNGDLPLIQKETLEKFIKEAQSKKLDSACYSVLVENPFSLGRIVKDHRGVFTDIREEKDASVEERKIKEINSGVYFFNAKFVEKHIDTLKNNNAQEEFYITDLLGNKNGQRSEAIPYKGKWDLSGVNTTYEWSQLRQVAQKRWQKKLSEDHGVIFYDPRSTYVSSKVKFSGACEIGAGTQITGASQIGKDVIIEGHCQLKNVQIDEGTHIKWSSVIHDSKIGKSAQIGPMAHIRPQSIVGSQTKVGNFVELKKTFLRDGAKASHLSYLGDSDIGENTNIGCGVITCNYDGVQKHQTKIGKNVFVGSDTQLVAPITVGDEAYIATGTVVTQEVPPGSLALSRPEFIVKEGYAKRLMKRFKESENKNEEE